jgi:GR25 family glycosyltransferase involved in LPS biosynthesis
MSRCVVIHLDSATERLPLIENIRQKMIHTLEVFSAKDGTDWEKSNKIAKIHPFEKIPVPRGHLGCTHSHIDIIHTSLKRKEKYTIIFEDDCELLGTQDDIYGFIHRASHLPKPWDIVLLGANEYVESTNVHTDYVSVKRFWGTHALVLTEKAMRAALQVFADAQKKGEFLPADWMYNEAIKQHGLVCYGPKKIDSLCRQKPGLISAINGKVRIAPKTTSQ